MQPPVIRSAGAADRPALDQLFARSWGGPIVVGHGVRYNLRTLPTLVAHGPDGGLAGALTYRIEGDGLEVVSIDADPPGRGTGSALLDAAVATARAHGLGRVWLVTTNDNLDALRFYQRRGLRLSGLAPGAVALSRRLKPGIPEIGGYGIPIRDELTLQLDLDDPPPPPAADIPGRSGQEPGGQET